MQLAKVSGERDDLSLKLDNSNKENGVLKEKYVTYIY